ncbi:hypothetical protein PPTG_24174 [Phytophthora nicotianae INRA-310]|uniref:Uncharacterized protein n=1 Tax=Phytophthora nicotianae (strain INRA-310) TaxID=761204 RepID=W2PIU2_PHYN3|nr:hypothetical protein PPTG_24174 [Phytophthora nicotianae INRA-310]ETN00918.1 hypothetical protein PPTG_24174 [Phytophthora nicotianae INRA-310]
MVLNLPLLGKITLAMSSPTHTQSSRAVMGGV